MSSDRRRLNLCYPRRPEDAGLDQLGSASLSWGLVSDGLRLPRTNESESLSHA